MQWTFHKVYRAKFNCKIIAAIGHFRGNSTYKIKDQFHFDVDIFVDSISNAPLTTIRQMCLAFFISFGTYQF